MIIQLANYILDIDVERTRAFYERSDILTVNEQCDCVNCQNYDKAIMRASEAVVDFLQSLGIDPRKPAEVYNVTGVLEEGGTVWYNGWYHVCGNIIEGPQTVQVEERTKTYRWEHSYVPDPDYSLAVLPVADNALLHKEFPTPAIQMEINTHLPYVLSTAFDIGSNG